MKKCVLLSVFALSFAANAQVSLQKTKLVKDGVKYKWSQYKSVFNSEESLQFAKKARTNKTYGDVLSSVGGFGIGFSLGLIIASPSQQHYSTPYGSYYVKADNSARWTVFGISTGIALLSVPFYSGAKKNMEKAVKLENGESLTEFKPYFDFKSEGSALAVSYNF